MLEIEIANRLSSPRTEDPRMRRAVRKILADAHIEHAEISIAVVGDEEMHRLNRRHLQHDYPTDVLSFVLSFEPSRLEGEVVVSYETASRQAEKYGWRAEDELLLYLVHGVLHLVGYEDASAKQRTEMRQRETEVLHFFNLTPHYDATPRDAAEETPHAPATDRVSARLGGEIE